MNQHRLIKSPENKRRDRVLVWHISKILKKLKIDHAITNVKLGKLAGVDPSQISKLQNGTLNQINYIRIVRALPEQVRTEYLDRVFFQPLPEALPPEVQAKIDKRVADREARRRQKIENSQASTNWAALEEPAPAPVDT